ncbi:MAG TPA: heavy metal-associated domain-containing protein [Burkholderiales bacterium]|nr:heavy metal-associated domain-containing protein [Burkholderiales bacterium]
METVVIEVGGMTCGGCVRSVTRVLQALPGVANAEVSLEKGEARVQFDPALASPARLKEAIENAGYEAA